jgi:hypothetical protein
VEAEAVLASLLDQLLRDPREAAEPAWDECLEELALRHVLDAELLGEVERACLEVGRALGRRILIGRPPSSARSYAATCVMDRVLDRLLLDTCLEALQPALRGLATPSASPGVAPVEEGAVLDLLTERLIANSLLRQ